MEFVRPGPVAKSVVPILSKKKCPVYKFLTGTFALTCLCHVCYRILTITAELGTALDCLLDVIPTLEEVSEISAIGAY